MTRQAMAPRLAMRTLVNKERKVSRERDEVGEGRPTLGALFRSRVQVETLASGPCALEPSAKTQRF